MAALVAGVQYGLSSHSNFYENKEVIFVKLTDSAQRAIDDYVRNLNSNEKPTIQFNGNDGKLTFPTSHGTAGFTFSLSSNQDIEGPQGAFECVQQTGQKSLESLGTLPCKMRIQANDDVYETTRHRMAVAEENNKNKCTRVIKANGPDIGRKVKVKAIRRTIPPPAKARTSESSIPRPMSQSSRPNAHPTTSMPSSSLLSSSTSSHKPVTTNNNPPARLQPNKKQLSDLMRRPLKERLVHLLAVRPYKKPEILDRILREGVKDREKNMVVGTINEIAYMKDNVYQLNRHMWNEVQEDWPFYTEQDKILLKRRKPQNLTPPGTSSDGSGHSPNSVHPGSPPGIIAPPPRYMSSKRPGYFEDSDGLQTKKPRISHYSKPETNKRTTTNSSVAMGNNNSSNNNKSSLTANSVPQVILPDNTSWNNRKSSYNLTSDCEMEVLNNSNRNSIDNNPSSSSQLSVSNIAKHNSQSSLSRYHSQTNGNGNNGDNNKALGSSNDGVSIQTATPSTTAPVRRASPVDDTRRQKEERLSWNVERECTRTRDPNTNVQDMTINNCAMPSNPVASCHLETINNREVVPVTNASVEASPGPTDNKENDLDTLYPPITSLKERRQYRKIFNEDYPEYRRLYAEQEKISTLFKHLGTRYKDAKALSEIAVSEKLAKEIEARFYALRTDPEKCAAKRRFNYLHMKLRHLQQQVEAFDQQYVNGIPNEEENVESMMDGRVTEY